ncbi:MAG: hypothetical protein KJ727_11580 [Acidobacteria bacterium]|nr:hypothetical protein [Acidobacteriota bacterium]
MKKMTRRKFTETSAILLGGLCLDPSKIFSNSTFRTNQEKEWSISEHFKEWIENPDYALPAKIPGLEDKEFPLEYPELVMVMKGNFSKYEYLNPTWLSNGEKFYLNDRDRYVTNVFGPDQDIYYAKLNLCTKKNLDIQVMVSDNPASLATKGRVYNLGGVNGTVNVLIPIEFIQSDRIFYQVFYKDGKGTFKPVSPPRCFRNPRYRSTAVICSYGDHHMFDDFFAQDYDQFGRKYLKANPFTIGGSAVKDGLDGRYFWDYFIRSFKDSEWVNNVGPFYEHNLKCTKNTFHKANLYAYLARENIWPDLIVDGGDGTGVQDYRYRRQGLPLDDERGNAYKLLRRERICSPFTPLAPEIKIRANHDGGGVWNKAHPHIAEFMPLMWPHPGELEGSSSLQNYYIIPLANGRVVHMALDSVSYSHFNNNQPNRPEHWRAGQEQKAWIADQTQKIQTDLLFVDQHNCFGGMPKSPDLRNYGGYGRGGGDTREYYENWNKICNYPPHYDPIDVTAVDQPKITEILSKIYSRVLLRKYHDHIETEANPVQPEVKTTKGLPILSMHIGTPNEIIEEKNWGEDIDCWIPEYGQPWELKYFNSPTLNMTTVEGNTAFIQTVCISHPDPLSNLNYFNQPVKIGDLLRQSVVSL